ncbi:MAG: hypothetical protein SPL02_02900 [Bacilli bacterium]|nr:hypothetical protein [Bacilli bacterium]MDY6430847.1 hypothetical protein [Bacilli bacterium]
MKNKVRLLIGIGAALMAMVAVFVLFANGFSQPERGNTFQIMFGASVLHQPAIPLLIVAFSFIVSAIGLGLIASFMPGLISRVLFFLTFGLLVAAGIIFLNTKGIVTKAYGLDALTTSPGLGNLGAGPILSAIFSFIGAVLCLYGTVKKDN